MGFRDSFQKKLQAEQATVAAARVESDRVMTEHEALVAELDPKLRALVLEVFAAMVSAGVPPIDVLKDIRDQNKTGVKAYVLGRVDSGYRGAYAPVAIDSEGRMAYKHPLIGTGTPVTSIYGCLPLNDGYERVLASASRGDEPMGACIHVSTSGDLIRSDRDPDSDWDKETKYRRTPLAEYLAQLAAETVARTP